MNFYRAQFWNDRTLMFEVFVQAKNAAAAESDAARSLRVAALFSKRAAPIKGRWTVTKEDATSTNEARKTQEMK